MPTIAPWYQAVNCKGDIAGVLALMEDRIARLPELRPFVQETCIQIVEREKREFLLYVGIGNQCPRGCLPTNIKDLLGGLNGARLPVFRNGKERWEAITFHLYTDCGEAEVLPVKADWLKKTEGKIIYFAPEPVRSTDFDANDLFDAPSPFAEQSDPESYLLAETKRYDQLLYLLSAKGEGSTETFGNYCATLWTSEADKNRVPKPAHVLRRLNLMGHLAIHPDGKQWRMLPPLLVCCHHDGAAGEDEKAAYTLVGKRDHSLICFLRDHADLESLPQERGDGPATQLVRLRLEGRDQIAARGVDFCDDYSACVHQSLPDFATWRKTLPSFTVPALCEYDPRLYDGDAFVRGAFTQTTGFYELWTLPQNETDTGKVWRTAFYEAGEQRWLSGDWYGLRYLSHSLRHGSGTMVHRTHEDGCEIVCSEAGRFPLPFERALVVASGRLPFRRKTERGGARLVYPDVPCSIAALVADKLSISLIK